MSSTTDFHLWVPYVMLTLVLIAMAVASFVKYHYKNKLKYKEKQEAAKMKTNKPFRKYRVKLGGRGLSESESKCEAGAPVANGISLCRSESKASDFRQWMNLDVRRFTHNHTNDPMVKQSPAHSQALAYSYNNAAFETSGTSDCDLVNSDYDMTDVTDIDVSGVSGVNVSELDSSDDNANTRIDDFLKNLQRYSKFDKHNYKQNYKEDTSLDPTLDPTHAMRNNIHPFPHYPHPYSHPYPHPIDSSTGYGTSTMVNSGDSFNLDTDTDTISTVNPSNRTSFISNQDSFISNPDSCVSFGSDQTYDARSQEARMAGYDSLGDTDDGVARVFVDDYDNYTDTDNVNTDNVNAAINRRHNDTDMDTDNFTDTDTFNRTLSDNSIIQRNNEVESATISSPRSQPSSKSAVTYDGMTQLLKEGAAAYDLPPGVRNRNQTQEDEEHITAL